MKQETFADIEYGCRKKKTKQWVGIIKPYYPSGGLGRPPIGIEKTLRMYLLQIWFNLSDPAYESNRTYNEGRNNYGCHNYRRTKFHKNAEKKRDPEMHQTKKAMNGDLV